MNNWEQRVPVTLLHERESEEAEGGYEAITMGGLPHKVTVSAGSSTSKEEALKRLCDALLVFGFKGTIAVHDVTHIGYSEEYEVIV